MSGKPLTRGLADPGSWPSRLPWARELPALAPLYSWAFDVHDKEFRQIDRDLQHRISKMTNLGVVQFLPQAMVSYGDFLLLRAQSRAAALEWYEYAHQIAHRHGFIRISKIATNRIRANSDVV